MYNLIALELQNQQSTAFLTLGNVLSSEDLQGQGGPSQSHTSREQQVTFYVIMIVIRVPVFHLCETEEDGGHRTGREGRRHIVYMRKHHTATESNLCFSGSLVPEAHLRSPRQRG